MSEERKESACLSRRHRVDALRRPRLATRATATLLLATLGLSGCVAGGLVRLGTWDRDPSPFWVVMREGVGCTVVFDTVLMRDYRLAPLTLKSSPIAWTCDPPRSHISGQTAASTSFDLSPAEIDLLQMKPSRTGSEMPQNRVLFGELPEWRLSLRLSGLRMGESPLCIVYVHVDRGLVVYNAGVNRDVHVIVGEGSRECSGPG